MKYEICKEVQIAGASYWTAIAWTDVRACAEEIVRAMTAAVPGSRYAAVRIAEPPEAVTSGGTKQKYKHPYYKGYGGGKQDGKSNY